MGYYVITCDYFEDNPGHKIAHESYKIDYTDKKKVLQLAKDLKINGITCFAADPAALTVSYVAEKLGLPAHPYDSIEIISNKDLLRAFLKENNFNVPKAKGYSSFKEVNSDIHNFTLPIVIKPVDSSASRGVSKVDSLEQLKEKVEYALSFSKVKRFIIEDYIEKIGYQVEGDVFIVNGKLVFRCFANEHFFPGYMNPVNPFVPIGDSWPSIFSEEFQDKIHNEIQRLIDLLNLSIGSLNFDIQIDEKGSIYILDIGTGNGGNMIQKVTNYATGVDLFKYTIKAALGEECNDLTLVKPNGYWSSYLINSQKSGIFKGIKIDEELMKQNIVEYNLTVNTDDYVQAYIGSNMQLGTIILKYNSMDEMLTKMDNMNKLINVLIEEG
ncbi:ATP-grasp domain-containing protein [Lysinibacillus endophyticus]|uniref:ATP-grasp domain-containing protein n=1 Tax=Ureibacillus endophyticus TaxID=1978490 RepID=UPI003136501E